MDERGSGIRRMQQAVAEQGGRSPAFELNGGEFTVTLFALPISVPPMVAGTKMPKAASVSPVSDSQEEIVRIVAAKGWVTSSGVTQKPGVANGTAIRILNAMITSKLLNKEGIGRGIRYYLTAAFRKRFPSHP